MFRGTQFSSTGSLTFSIPRYAPSRNDNHHWHYCRLEPSHRLAVLNYRTTGLILPFGARKDHFNRPNRFMFSKEGLWLEDERASPLDSWEYVDFALAAFCSIRSHLSTSQVSLPLFKRAKRVVFSGPTSMGASISTFQTNYALLRTVSAASVSTFAFFAWILATYPRVSAKTSLQRVEYQRIVCSTESTFRISSTTSNMSPSLVFSRLGARCSRKTNTPRSLDPHPTGTPSGRIPILCRTMKRG